MPIRCHRTGPGFARWLLALLLLALPLDLDGDLRAAPAGLPDLGARGDLLPDAPLVVAIPALSHAAHRLHPLLARLGLALPDLDPARLFIELRVRLGIDFFDRQSLEAAGLDPTGPLYFIDDGTLSRPTLLVRLLDGGLERFRTHAVARVVAREQLVTPLSRRHAGVQVEAHSVATDADPRLAYAVDGALLALAPLGCDRDLRAPAQALRPRQLLLRSRPARRVLQGLGDAALIAVVGAEALRVSPYASTRRAAADLRRAALSLDIEGERAVLRAQLLPSAQGQRRTAGWQALGDGARQQVRQLGALSIWYGLMAGKGAVLPERLPYLPALQQSLGAENIPLDAELRGLAHGGLGLHLFDLEPLLPGLTERRSIDPVSTAFFAEQALTVPLRDPQRAADLLRRVDRMLGKRPGQLAVGGEAAGRPRTYAENGRVLDYAQTGDWLLVSSGPGTAEQLRTDLAQRPVEELPAQTLVALRSDGARLRALLGRVGLLGAGDNNDLRAVWAIRQAAAPALAKLGRLRADLRRQGELLRLESSAELTGSVQPPRRSPLDPRRLDVDPRELRLDPSRLRGPGGR